MRYGLYLILAGAILAGHCQSSSSSSARVVSDDVVQVYNENCSGCHGNRLQRFKRLGAAEKDSEWISGIIKDGDEDNGMPAFSILGDEMIAKLTDYIKGYDYSENFISEVSGEKNYTVEVVVDGLEIPWGMEFLPNGDILVAERKGVLSRFSPDGGLQRISGLPQIRAKGQGGLMDLKLHPNYEETAWLYISYSYVDEGNDDAGNTAIIRGRLEGNSLTNIEQIYRGTPATTGNRHFGSRMVFDDKGFLYFSIGDRGKRDTYPQKLNNSNGKIHRLHDDGRVPEDNPFAKEKKAEGSIYTYGNRNPQGIAKHPVTGEIWQHEHGPKGGDEINIVKPGLNYGWPVISYGINYIGTKFTDITEKQGMEQPVYYYVPSIAPCGMAFVDSDVYPDWKNNLLIGSLKFQYLERIVLYEDQVVHQEKMLEELDSRVRDVRIGPDGYIYVAVENPGRILKIIPK